jgi:tRNA-specific 2-thiouridylase
VTGVDSSLAAALLVEQGYDVAAGFIKNWSDTKDLWTGECAWRTERRDALRVAASLGITLYTFDFEASYRERVLDRMFAEYEKGLTPNPDVLCNEEIKFGLFLKKRSAVGLHGSRRGIMPKSITMKMEHRIFCVAQILQKTNLIFCIA